MSYQFALARYNEDGGLDTSFDYDGKVLTEFVSSSGAQANALAIDGRGKIVVGGWARIDRGGQFALARFNEDGSLDNSFHFNGKLLTDFTSSSSEGVSAVAIDDHGKIVVGGRAAYYSDTGQEIVALAKYNVDGSLDRDFGAEGKVLTNFRWMRERGGACGMAIDYRGRIITLGTGVERTSDHLVLVSHNPDGSQHNNYIITFTRLSSLYTTSLAIDGQGRILVGGWTELEGRSEGNHFYVARFLNPDEGMMMDDSFNRRYGMGGYIVTDFLSASRERINAIAVDGRGRVVVGGWAQVSGRHQFALARYSDDGTLDTTFHYDGKVLTDFRSSSREQITAIALDGRGRIVVGGWAQVSDGSQFALARYLDDGSLDTSFHYDGKVLTNFYSASIEQINAIAIDDRGRIVVAGFALVDD